MDCRDLALPTKVFLLATDFTDIFRSFRFINPYCKVIAFGYVLVENFAPVLKCSKKDFWGDPRVYVCPIR